MLLIAAAGAIVAACSDATTALDGFGRAGIRSELRRQEALWESHGITDYRYQFRRSCDCPPISTTPVEIEVRNGNVTIVRLLSTGEVVPTDAAFWPSVAQLFDEIRLALDEGASRVEARYDPVYGYPLEIEIEWPSVAGPNTIRLFAAELIAIE